MAGRQRIEWGIDGVDRQVRIECQACHCGAPVVTPTRQPCVGVLLGGHELATAGSLLVGVCVDSLDRLIAPLFGRDYATGAFDQRGQRWFGQGRLINAERGEMGLSGRVFARDGLLKGRRPGQGVIAGCACVEDLLAFGQPLTHRRRCAGGEIGVCPGVFPGCLVFGQALFAGRQTGLPLGQRLLALGEMSRALGIGRDGSRGIKTRIGQGVGFVGQMRHGGHRIALCRRVEIGLLVKQIGPAVFDITTLHEPPDGITAGTQCDQCLAVRQLGIGPTPGQGVALAGDVVG